MTVTDVQGAADDVAKLEPAAHLSTRAAIQWLRENGMLRWEAKPGNPKDGTWSPRPLGLATQASGLMPEYALMVKQACLLLT